MFLFFSVVGFADVMPSLWKQACNNDGLLIQIGVFDRLIGKEEESVDGGFDEAIANASNYFGLLDVILSNVSLRFLNCEI